MKNLLLAGLMLAAVALKAQNNVRAWYADGQVWVVWEVYDSFPETFGIYAKPTPFTSTNSAVLLGRPFALECIPLALREQVDSTATFRIPDGQGGLYQLGSNEALFVATPHQAGSSWIAVVPWGTTEVVQGQNITQGPVSFQYNPVADPVECHLQKAFPSPFAPDYICLAFYMWADGRQNQWENRPDFPVMANAAKNGMPSMFLLSVPIGLDTTGGVPLTVWLHGGGGTARQSLAGSRPIINLNPEKGILLAHNDDFLGYWLNQFTGYEGVTRHFGWRKNYDPFTGAAPAGIDTIVNYTQRRYRWIDDWMVRRLNVDPNRININGHSMGSKGTMMLAKTFPDHYASATVLNNGYEEDDPPMQIDVLFGPSALDFPTNLKNREGETIGFSRAMNLTTRLSQARDLPLIRVFDGKNDTETGASWDSYVVAQYRAADSTGLGAQLYWSERSHGPDTGPDYNDHWLNGLLPTQQTAVDDVSVEENFRSDQSFPAFFNHRLDPQNNDPGDGTPGTGPAGDGDDWGTWGGYHRWDLNNVTDEPGAWSVVAWLEGNAVFGNDNCPVNNLKADLAIRKPQQFKPVTGKLLNWVVKDVASGNNLQSGQVTVQADNLVIIPEVTVFKENIRRVRIVVADPSVAVAEPEALPGDVKIQPNPSNDWAELVFENPGEAQTAQIRALAMDGRVYSMDAAVVTGTNRIALTTWSRVPVGIYVVELRMAGMYKSLRWLKL